MQKRILTSLGVTVGLALVAAACGNDTVDEGTPQSDDTLPDVDVPGDGDGYVHPTGADEVVIQYSNVGGFVPREFAFQQTPNLLISGDGEAFSPGAQIEIYPGPLLPAIQVQSITEAGIQEILAAADAAGLFADIDYESPTNIADASTAQLTISVDGETYVHEAYALGLGTPAEAGELLPERQALAEFLVQLGDLPTLVGEENLGELSLFEAEAYAVESVVVDDLAAYGTEIEPTVVEWPSSASVRLADASTCTLVSATDVGSTLQAANQLTFFTDDGITYQVLARPVLPGDTC
ncbi:MAG: hypothetical protein WBP59_08745 [Ilumatobacteraceae bacterium]